MRPNPTRSTASALVAAVALVLLGVAGPLVGCGSEGNDEGGGSGGEPVGSGEEVEVRIVADSEIPDEVAELLDQEPGVAVASAISADGATMAQLDESAEQALAAEPDAFLYAGGTNDLPAGPLQMLEDLQARLTRWSEDACVVVAVPIFRYERGTPAEVAERTAGTRVLEDAVAEAGGRVVSYLDVSLAMDEAGEDFFAEGELGDLHPGPAAYPRIARALAAEVRRCA